jgi:hypothetical protein
VAAAAGDAKLVAALRDHLEARVSMVSWKDGGGGGVAAPLFLGGLEEKGFTASKARDENFEGRLLTQHDLMT